MVFLPQLYAYINWLMNSFSVFKLIIPTLKATNKIYQPHADNTPQILKHLFSPMSSLPQWSPVDHSLPLPNMPLQNGIPFKLPIDDQEQKLKDEEETTKSSCSFPQSDNQLHKNIISNRVKSLQYEANNPCQDTLACDQLKVIDAYAVSVFDGHGGPQLAEYCRSKIHSFIDCYLSDHLSSFISIGDAIKESLKWSYQKIEDTFFQTYEKQLKLGNKRIRSVGSCAITAVVHNDRIYLANSGDSQAIFLLSDGMGIRSMKANQRLSVNCRSERERLKKQWAESDEEIITEQGGAYYLKGRLQPTRTIGDYYLKKEQYYQGSGPFRGPYLNCLPDVEEHQITSAHRYLVVASDGVWDALSKNQVAQALLRQRQIDLSKTCYDMDEDEPPYLGSVVNRILQRTSQMSGLSMQELKAMPKGQRRNYHDDITLAVIDLQLQL